MKRELKLDRKALDGEVRVSDCRAYPDEKGIETRRGGVPVLSGMLQLQSLSR